MYYLRRRHGRKPQSAQRSDTPPVVQPEVAPLDPQSGYPEPQDLAPPRPVVITKPRRPRVDTPEDENCPPAGTFRAGTLHIARAIQSSASHGEH